MTIFASRALLPAGWADDVRIAIGGDGRIASIETGAAAPDDVRVDALLPAPASLHSHAFQRAIAGLSEYRTSGSDSFWTWRDVMYRYVGALGPDEVEAISALAFMEMAEAGYASVAEFHYLHNAPDGSPYADRAEMAKRVVAAAEAAGLGLTLLPVYYAYGGAGKAPLSPAQMRFASDIDMYAELRAAIGAEASVGTAFHSLRAIAPEDIDILTEAFAGDVFHIHIAEQTKEVDDVKAWLGARPVEWLLANAPVGETWTLVHATHMTASETLALAQSGAVAGICPVTEANLGDGVFPGADYLDAGGRWGVGTDSNVAISLAGELSMFEYSQRLALRKRNALSAPPRSTGRTLYDGALAGGAASLGRDAGRIEAGAVADFVALDPARMIAANLSGDLLLDAFIFAGGANAVCDVWSAGRHVVKGGRHVARDKIVARARAALARLASI